jgi:L-alanine-DL-glutamate epimerase-like enolase superfamily enzyme
MKISDIRTVSVELPLEKPVKTAIHNIESASALLVFVDTDDGITGESYLFTLNARRLGVFREMVLSLKDVVVGRNPLYTEEIWHVMWRDINFFGHKGISVFGISAVDTACWDIAGKACGQPVYRLLGAFRDSVPVYASGGLWTSADIEELVEEAERFVAMGFKAMKMRIGKPRLEEDVERVGAVRRAVGDHISLMVDANQGFAVDHAIKIGRKLEEFNLTWFEEPVAAYDLEGASRVAATLDLPVASGETEYTRYGFRQMIESRAADVLMPDLGRVGGITELLKVAHMAEAYDLAVSPHIFPEQSLQILGALPNGTYLEHIPWYAPLYKTALQMKDGIVTLPHRPGLGFEFDPEAIERYRIEG